MGRAKEIIVKVIPSKIANEFVKKNHYSGKVVNMSTLHFGCFLDNKLHGVMSYGPPMDKRNVLDLVDTGLNDHNKKWNEMLELNRMAFDDYLPKYSESRCIAISIKLIKKNAKGIFNVGTGEKELFQIAPLANVVKAPYNTPKDTRMNLNKLNTFLNE